MPGSLFSTTDLIRFLPELILTAMGTLLMVLDPIINKRSSSAFGHLSIAAFLTAIVGSVFAYRNPGPAFGGMLMVDGFATFFRVLSMLVGVLTVLLSYSYLRRQDAFGDQEDVRAEICPLMS